MLYDEEARGEIDSSQKAMEEILRVILDSNDVDTPPRKQGGVSSFNGSKRFAKRSIYIQVSA